MGCTACALRRVSVDTFRRRSPPTCRGLKLILGADAVLDRLRALVPAVQVAEIDMIRLAAAAGIQSTAASSVCGRHRSPALPSTPVIPAICWPDEYAGAYLSGAPQQFLTLPKP